MRSYVVIRFIFVLQFLIYLLFILFGVTLFLSRSLSLILRVCSIALVLLLDCRRRQAK